MIKIIPLFIFLCLMGSLSFESQAQKTVSENLKDIGKKLRDRDLKNRESIKELKDLLLRYQGQLHQQNKSIDKLKQRLKNSEIQAMQMDRSLSDLKSLTTEHQEKLTQQQQQIDRQIERHIQDSSLINGHDRLFIVLFTKMQLSREIQKLAIKESHSNPVILEGLKGIIKIPRSDTGSTAREIKPSDSPRALISRFTYYNSKSAQAGFWLGVTPKNKVLVGGVLGYNALTEKKGFEALASCMLTLPNYFSIFADAGYHFGAQKLQSGVGVMAHFNPIGVGVVYNTQNNVGLTIIYKIR